MVVKPARCTSALRSLSAGRMLEATSENNVFNAFAAAGVTSDPRFEVAAVVRGKFKSDAFT